MEHALVGPNIALQVEEYEPVLEDQPFCRGLEHWQQSQPVAQLLETASKAREGIWHMSDDVHFAWRVQAVE